MSDYRWFRLYHDMPFDPKLRYSMNPTQWWAWVCVMCIASSSKNRGTMSKECAKNVLADMARISEESAEECLEHFLSLGLIRASKTTYSLVAWENRQFPSDSSTPRVKRYRERSMKRSCNLPESEKEKDLKHLSDKPDKEALEPPSYPSDFLAFWEAYPRREKKGDALRAWKVARKHYDAETIIAGIEPYKASEKVRAGFVQLPATWLRARCWEDESIPFIPADDGVVFGVQY